MRSLIICSLFVLLLCANSIHGDCDDKDNKDTSDDTFHTKEIGCSIKKLAESAQETTKQLIEKVGKKFDDFKHAVKWDESTPTPGGAVGNHAPIEEAPTVKVPLAPLNAAPA